MIFPCIFTKKPASFFKNPKHFQHKTKEFSVKTLGIFEKRGGLFAWETNYPEFVVYIHKKTLPSSLITPRMVVYDELGRVRLPSDRYFS